MSDRWSFDVRCNRCGGPLAPVAVGVSSGADTRAVAKCQTPRCGLEWLLAVSMGLTVPRDEYRQAPCGTPTGYQRHCKRDEEPCAECRAAWARHNQHSPYRVQSDTVRLGLSTETIASRRHLYAGESP